jgi:MYXO-CTERM domain-containing protein
MKTQTFASLAALIATQLFVSQPALADGLVGPSADLLSIDDEFIVSLAEPTGIAFLPDGRILVTQRAGDLIVVSADGQTKASAGKLASVDTGFQEKGLLNVAVHPDYATNHIIFLYYTKSGSGNQVVSIELGDDGKLDMTTEKALVEGIAAPLNHDGGGLAVNDGYLYIGTGDSGSNTNKVPYAQTVGNYYPTCLTNLNGKVLRLNLDGTIPADNPLVGKTVTACGTSPSTKPTTTGPARGEIFAWGFRNAFRVWADPMTGNLWVGHVGEVQFEMIDVVPPTGNLHFGWPFQEGGVGFPDDECTKYEPNVGNCTKPVYSCEQSDGENGSIPAGAPCSEWGSECDNPDVPNDCDSITGGVILTGCEWPESLRGKYVFGDYTSKNVWTLPVNEARDNVIGEREQLAVTQGTGPAAFAENAGALYIVAHTRMAGYVTKITPKMSNADCAPAPGPSMMTDAGPAPVDTMTPPVGTDVPVPSTMTSSAPAPSTSGATPTPTAGSSAAPPAMSSAASGSAAVPPAASSAPGAGTSGPAPSAPVVGDGGDTGKAGGCSCEVVGVRTNRFGAFAMLGLVAAWFARRRRNS